MEHLPECFQPLQYRLHPSPEGSFYQSDPLFLHVLSFRLPKKKRKVFVPGARAIDSSSELLTTEAR
jgi:hypothetical protein